MDLEQQKIKTRIESLLMVCLGGYQTRIISFAVAIDLLHRSVLRSILD